MKIISAFLLLISLSAHAKLECQFTQEKEFNQVKEDLVMDGKGTREVNDIMSARIDICKDRCPQTDFMKGICMARKPSEEPSEKPELIKPGKKLRRR